MAETIADGLSDRGYDATAVAGGEQALARLRAEPFDALVTDLRMPGVDGFALLAAARRITPDLPVIVMTAIGAIDPAIESIRQGASHYVTKPFRVEDLALFLDRALDERRVRREVAALRAVLGGEEPALAGVVLPIREVTRRYACWALEQLGGHRTRTAERLGIDMKTLAKWLSEAEGSG